MLSLFGSNVGEEELAAVGDCLRRQWLGIGARTEEFERRIAEKVGAHGFVFLNSGSNSLQMALRLMELPKGSEVVLPTFTWIACANAVRLNELVPVFCDVDPRTCNVRPEDVDAKRTSNTSAIMVVHYGGKPVDMEGMAALGLPILEDAAHAIDSYTRGRHCGTIGDLGIFSFDAVKNLTTCEGGGVVARDPARLEKLPAFQARRRELWDRYNSILRHEDWSADWIVTLEDAAPHEQHSYFCYLIQLEAGSRDALAKFLYDRDVYTSLRFHPLHLNPLYASSDRLPNAERLSEVALNLPLHHRMEIADVERVCELLRDFRRAHV